MPNVRNIKPIKPKGPYSKIKELNDRFILFKFRLFLFLIKANARFAGGIHKNKMELAAVVNKRIMLIDLKKIRPKNSKRIKEIKVKAMRTLIIRLLESRIFFMLRFNLSPLFKYLVRVLNSEGFCNH